MPTLRLPKFLLAGLGLFLTVAACTPPTPPPSPTPWPNATQISTESSAGPRATSSRPLETSTPSRFTPTPRPTLDLADTGSRTTFTVWENLSEAQAQLLVNDINAFQAENPQYQVSLQHYNGPEEFMTSLTADQISFDVVLASPILLSSLWSGERIAPMSDFFPPSFIDGFDAVTLLGASRDGVAWGLPDTAGFHLLLFYNQDLVASPPTSVDELSELGERLTTGSQRGLGVNSYDPLWLIPWLAPYGGWLIDDAGQTTLNTSSLDDAMTLFLSWQDRSSGIAPVGTYDEIRTKFLNGDIAMMIDGEWAIAELARTDKINWGVTLLPSVGQTVGDQPAAALVLGRYWAISQTTTGNRAQAAAAFLEFISHPQRQLVWTSQFGLLPTRREALEDPMIVNDPVWRVSAAQMQAGRGVPLGVNVNLLLDAMREPLRGVIDGELSPQEAAEMMQNNVRQ